MKTEKISGRRLKNKLLEVFKKEDLEKGLEEILKLPARQAVNPLFSFFYNSDELIKWRSVTAMGAVVADLAMQDMESARVVMRRLIWNLNDESGGIGWGSPEAMGEIMACHPGLADEYSCILISYIMRNGNFIEYEALQRGVIWGVGRLAHARPALVVSATPHILPFMESNDATIRGFAAWTAGALSPILTKPILAKLSDDKIKIHIFLNRQLVECTIGKLAGDALTKIKQQHHSS